MDAKPGAGHRSRRADSMPSSVIVLLAEAIALMAVIGCVVAALRL